MKAGILIYKKTALVFIIILLSFIGYLNIKSTKANNKVDETKIVESKANWSVDLNQQKSKEPDLYQAYKIKIKNMGKTTGTVKVEVFQPLTKDSKVIYLPETTEIKPGKTYEMGEIYAMNNHPQKYVVDLIWEEKNVEYKERFTIYNSYNIFN